MASRLRSLYVFFIQLFPVRYRFGVVTLFSYLFAPILQFAPFMKKHRQANFKFDTDMSPALLWCIRPLMTIDLGLKVTIDDQLISNAVQSNKGTVLVCYHGTFMPLIMPYLYDNQFDVHSWSIREREVYFGREINHSLTPSPTAFFKAKNLLMSSEMIAVMIDFEAHYVKRAQEINTQFGKMYITDSFFKLATTCQSNVVFVKYALKGKQVMFELGKPADVAAGAEEITKQYTRFLHKQAPIAAETEFTLNNALVYPQVA
jgi:hypothetical protein